MKIKKVFIIYSGAKVMGGIETYLDNLFNSYDKEKLDLVLVSLGTWELTEKLNNEGHKVIVLSSKRIRFSTITDIVSLIKKEKADLLVSQGVIANYYARKVAQQSKTPLLTTIHSNIEYEYPNELIKLAYKISDRVARKHTSRFITVSKYLKAELIKTGIPADMISVIYNGIEVDSVMPNPKNMLSGESVIIGSIGRFHYIKGYHNLIESMSYLKNLPVKLMLFGDGEEKKGLEELVIKFGLQEIVSFPGYAENIDKALEKIDIYVQPSITEGFGLTVIEAMAVGKPVIVTPVGGLQEVVTDTETGLIAADTNPESLAIMIKTLVKNPELAKELAQAGHKEVLEKYTLDRWIKETEKVYLETAK